MLGMVTPSSLAAVSNSSAGSLEHLSLLDNQLVPLLGVVELERLPHLHSLALDFSDFSAAMCRLLSGGDRAPLHRLSLLLNGGALAGKPLNGTPADDDWKALVRHSANLRVYIMALDTGSQDLLAILKPSIPLERIHFDSYSASTSEATVELISLQYHKTLTHFTLMRDDGSFPDLSDNRNEDPLVLLAWRCIHLSVLVIHGERCSTGAQAGTFSPPPFCVVPGSRRTPIQYGSRACLSVHRLHGVGPQPHRHLTPAWLQPEGAGRVGGEHQLRPVPDLLHGGRPRAQPYQGGVSGTGPRLAPRDGCQRRPERTHTALLPRGAELQ